MGRQAGSALTAKRESRFIQGETRSTECGLCQKSRGHEMWGWLVSMGWVISWANEWGNRASAHFYRWLWNCHGAGGCVI